MSFCEKLSPFWDNLEYTLFPYLERRTGELSDEYKKLVATLELVRIEDFIPEHFCFGRIPKDRASIARGFVAKMVLKLPYTKQLVSLLNRDNQLKLICGWQPYEKIPSESKFSRAFKEFSLLALPDKVHQHLIKACYEGVTIAHLATDSTSISVREKPIRKKNAKLRKKERDAARRKKVQTGELNVRQKQLIEPNLDLILQSLPKVCDRGLKRNAHGYHVSWHGYKLHTSVDDHGIAIAAIVTSASCNDGTVAIPLAIKSDKVAHNFYDLMDAAYDHPEIKEHSRSLGHIPIIDACPHNKAQKTQKEHEMSTRKKLNLTTAEDQRYKNRFPRESFHAVYKDYYGGRTQFYRGIDKVSCHVLFGILALTASQILNLST